MDPRARTTPGRRGVMERGEYQCYAVCAPGLEELTARELTTLGARPEVAEAGGVPFRADDALLCQANLQLRTASRVLVRIASFHAEAFHELERHGRRIPWERFVAAGAPARFRVTCRKSRLYHSDAVAQRLAAALASRAGAVPAAQAGATADAEEEDDPAQLFVVRLLHDRCTVSVDSSGALLHRRGYRQAVARAPLRETLAAAMLLGAGWHPDTPLLDPMCGSGTIAIEGALLARRIAPGLRRAFALERWPESVADALVRARERAAADVLPRAPAPIRGSDRDDGAVAAAQANAERAGVAADICFDRRALSDLDPPSEPGWLVTNPPYGERVGERQPLRALYARLGQLVRDRLPGWQIALLSADRRLEGQTALRFEERLRTLNGGIPVRLLTTRA